MTEQVQMLDKTAMKAIFNRMELCLCGSGTDWDLILLILERGEDHDKNGSFYDKAEDAASRWVEFAAHVLDAWGLLAHGTGIGWAWLTDDGKSVLAWLREHGTDIRNWPEWWGHSSEGCPCEDCE